MENSTSTDVDRSCNIRKVQFELRCGFAETYFTDIHSRDKFGIAICLWTQHLTVLPVSWVSEIQLQLFSSRAVISHGFLTNSTQRWLLFLSSSFVVLFGASSSSSSSSLIGPCASPSLSTGVIPFHLESVRQPVSHLGVWLFTGGKRSGQIEQKSALEGWRDGWRDW